ncbi:MAG TPA: hypothetical protein VHK90_08930, partial [Thermoanaerobaculia bacterium]|nr:hypothetical protein [Thermoanaerobaculia bacterium]
VVAILVAALQIPSLRHVWRASHDRAHDVPAAGRAIRAAVPPHESVFAFDPTWTLAAGRLPPHGDGAPVVVDSYGAMLLEAVQSGKRFRDTGAAFQSGVAQPDVRARLEKSPYAILGWRGNWQLGFEDRLWFASNFLCTTPEAGEQCVWGRTREPIGPALAYAGDAKVDFGEGWYDEEGFPAWRWMAATSVTTLPAIPTPARLQLYVHAPHEANVTIELGGRVLDRFRATPGEFFRSYDVHASGAQTLVITTDRTLNPARDGQSADDRDLGLSLKRLIWLPLTEWPARGGGASTSSRR